MLKVISIIGYLSMVAGIIALFLKHCLFSWSPVIIAVQAGALALMVWARVTFGRRSYHFAANPTEGGLVTSGPYRFIRHPIYSAVCIFTIAGVAAHWSWQSAAIGGVVLAGAIVRLRCEEILLTKRYPDYVQYAAKTWRLLPYLF